MTVGLVLLGLVLLAGPAFAGQERLSDAATLTEVTALAVAIDGAGVSLEDDGLNATAIEQDIEEQLRDVGLEIVPLDAIRALEVPGTKKSRDGITAPGRPVLRLRLDAVPISGTDLYAYWIRLGLYQDVYLAREVGKRKLWASTVTWRAMDRSGVVEEAYLDSLTDDVADSLDEFVTAYEAANLTIGR